MQYNTSEEFYNFFKFTTSHKKTFTTIFTCFSQKTKIKSSYNYTYVLNLSFVILTYIFRSKQFKT